MPVKFLKKLINNFFYQQTTGIIQKRIFPRPLGQICPNCIIDSSQSRFRHESQQLRTAMY